MKVQSVALEMCLNLDGKIAIIYSTISLNTCRYCVELNCLVSVSFIIYFGWGGVGVQEDKPIHAVTCTLCARNVQDFLFL